jgi:predicted protein tyrosine phosphatase
MINKIKITDLSDAESYSFNKNNKDYDIWISVVDEADRRKVSRMKRNFSEKGVRSFAQFFYDWSDEDNHIWAHLKEDGPQKHHVEKIINFIRLFANDDKPHRLGVNCFAGISRSTAVGIIALVMAGRTPEQALTEILKNRPEAWPNLRILRFASEILGTDVHTAVKKWKEQLTNSKELFLPPDRKLSPHHEEIMNDNKAKKWSEQERKMWENKAKQMKQL